MRIARSLTKTNSTSPCNRLQPEKPLTLNPQPFMRHAHDAVTHPALSVPAVVQLVRGTSPSEGLPCELRPGWFT
eukprot:4251210-Amphidinium_carterae.1